MSGYKVKVLQPNNWRRYPVGRLDISVGKEKHEGEKFAAAVLWAEQKFSHVIISVADTLQRFNYMAEGLDKEAAYNLSYKMGTDWIMRNRKYLEGKTIIRWDERLNHPLYKQYIKRTKQTINHCKNLRDSIKLEALDYTSRIGSELTSERMQYLIEEIAVFDMLFKIEPAADVYPGSILPFWEHKAYESKAAFTRIDFTRRKKQTAA